MPYYTDKKAIAKPKKKVVIKKKKNAGMSQNQKDKLKEHSKHHSAKHMSMMKKMIKGGASFSRAHNAAKKMVGK